jgi:3-methyl-2-oxobutanoate hydroxymethyltransferase
MKAGAEAVKLEGAYLGQIAALTKAGIPVVGHLGYTPQSYHVFGGAKVQGKSDEGERLFEAAKAVCSAGAVAIVLELIPSDLADRITKEIACPTIGIGAGKHCDGQIQVIHDVLGLSSIKPRHAMTMIDGRAIMVDAIKEFAAKVKVPSSA